MSTDAGRRADAEDVALVRDWFETLATHVRAKDFAAAYPLFHEDFLVFGTFSDFVEGRADGERKQWRNVWPNISDFRFRLDDVRAIVSPDRLFAVGLGIFDSTGYHKDGTAYDRPGRATVTLDRKKVGDPWVANHTHMSLFRDVPSVSHGIKAA